MGTRFTLSSKPRLWIAATAMLLAFAVSLGAAQHTFAGPPAPSATTQLAKLTSSDAEVNSTFGLSMAASGDGTTVVVGAPDSVGFPASGNDHIGAVYVFVKPAGGWASATQTARLALSSRSSTDRLGLSVAISDDGGTIVVGGPGSNECAGAVYIYTRPAGGWANGTETHRLINSDTSPGCIFGSFLGDNFGSTVDISSDGRTIVAKSNGGVDAHVRGALYVFVKPAGGWANTTETARFTASDAATGNNLGASLGVSADGKTIAAGAPGRAGGGAVYVFVKPAGNWVNGTENARLTASDAAANGNLGTATDISADGSTIAGGMPSRAGGGGSYIYDRPAGGWATGTETARLTASDSASTDNLGRSVGLSADGSVLLAGSIGNAGGGEYRGAAYGYVRPAGGWASANQTGKLTAADGQDNNSLGYAAAVTDDNTTLFTTIVGQDILGSLGAVYVFSGTLTPPVLNSKIYLPLVLHR